MNYKPGYTENGYSFVGGDPADEKNWKQVGAIEDGYKFKGGDPASKDAWEEVKEPDMSSTKKVIEHNLAVQQTVAKAKGKEVPAEDSFLDSVKHAFGGFEYGYQNSVVGLLANGKLPKDVPPEEMDSFARIGSQVGQLAGDLPAMILGAGIGGTIGGAEGAAAGSVVPGAGTAAGGLTMGAVGAGVGAFAMPAVLRQALVDHYQKGDIQSGRDFMERTSGLFLTALKEGSIGAATTAIGGRVGVEVAKTSLPVITKAALPPVAELATMTTLSKAAEGHLPNAQDFIDGAIVLAGVHGATSAAGKLRDVYAKTGMKPIEVGEKIADHPTIPQEILADNMPFPKALENYVEKPASPKAELTKLEPYNPEVAIESAMKDMVKELKSSYREKGVARDSEGNVLGNTDYNTYPDWFEKVKSGNLEKTLEALKNPESAASKRLRAEAESRLTEGYKIDRNAGGYEPPDAQFRAAKGLDPHEATPVKTGEVIHFDGTDGVIRTPEGETVHFDVSTVKENFKVGDTVHFLPDAKNAEFATTESVFGTRTKEQIEAKNAPKEDVLIPKEDGSVEVQTGDGGTRPPTDEEKILGRIGERGPRKSSGLSFEKLYTDLVDKFNPIKLAVEEMGQKLGSNENPYDLARMANDYKAKVKHVFQFGTLDYNTLKKTGKSFKEIIEPFAGNAKEIDGLKAYMISARALEIESRGIKSGFDLVAAQNVVKAGEAKYAKAAKELVEFQNSSLKYAKDAGLISEKAFKTMKAMGENYVSFSRIFEEGELGGRTPGKSKPLKNLKGSERMIQDPFVSMIENTEALFKAAEANRAAKAMVELADNTPGQEVIQKVKNKMKPIEISEAEVKKAFEKSEDGAAVLDFLKSMDAEMEHEAFTIFRPAEKRNLGPNEFDVMIDGKRQVYETDPELADAFKRLGNNTGSMNLAFKIFNKITALKKLGITFTPDFQLKNVFRDQLTAGVFTEGGAIPFKDIFSAMGDIVGKSEHYQNWLKSGGAGGAFLELNNEYLSKDLLNISKETGIADKAFNLVKKPAEFLALSGTIMEEATRLAEFKRVTKGATEGSAVFKGGMASREVTVDFQRIGAKMSALNAITAFQNVAIQGLDRTGRAIKADPAGVMTKGLMYLTAPSLALWWANHDDERYKEIPRWQKDLFWIIPTNDWQPVKDMAEIDGVGKHLVRQKEDGSYEINRGHIYRLPKPQELGLIFGTLPERMAEKFFTDNPRAVKDFGETIGGLVTPNFIPDSILPLVEQAVNKNLFTSAPLVSPQMEERLPQLQYTEYTSTTAKVLGKVIGQIPLAKDIGPETTKLASPAVVDNYIKSWTGALGSYVIEALDKSLEKSGVVQDPNRATKTVADIPFVKAFVVRYPSASPQSITDFYSRSREAGKVFNSIKFLKDQGDEKGMKEIINDPEYQSIMVQTGEIKTALGQMSSALHKINANKEMSPDEKRQQSDTIYYMMSEVAKQGNAYMDQWEKAVKAKNFKK